MTQMLAQREHDYFAETVICANCYIVAYIIEIQIDPPAGGSISFSVY